jgi:hypothetical protein
MELTHCGRRKMCWKISVQTQRPSLEDFVAYSNAARLDGSAKPINPSQAQRTMTCIHSGRLQSCLRHISNMTVPRRSCCVAGTNKRWNERRTAAKPVPTHATLKHVDRFSQTTRQSPASAGCRSRSACKYVVPPVAEYI